MGLVKQKQCSMIRTIIRTILTILTILTIMFMLNIQTKTAYASDAPNAAQNYAGAIVDSMGKIKQSSCLIQ